MLRKHVRGECLIESFATTGALSLETKGLDVAASVVGAATSARSALSVVSSDGFWKSVKGSLALPGLPDKRDQGPLTSLVQPSVQSPAGGRTPQASLDTTARVTTLPVHRNTVDSSRKLQPSDMPFPPARSWTHPLTPNCPTIPCWAAEYTTNRLTRSLRQRPNQHPPLHPEPSLIF